MPQYIVTIEEASEYVSKSLSAILAKGFFLLFMMRNTIRTMNTIRAYDGINIE